MVKKKIGRIQDAEIKKQLRNFAKKEFYEKKPLEIRVLQVKPRVVFKKGSMLPNLMIKKLAGTAYVIYLDYGDQLKFYYFDKSGRSLGGANFDKSKKLLKEMHGKATTLLKLPKTIHIIGLENENKKIKDSWEKLSKKYSQKFTIQIKNLPAISIKKNITKNTIRIGIGQDKDILHFDYDYYNTELQDIILLRELFPILTNTSANKETVLMISTIFTLVFGDLKKYYETIKKINVKKSVNKKAIRWIQAIFLPYLKDNPEKKEEIAKFLLRTCMIIRGNDLFVFYEFFDLFLLWFMKFGVGRYLQLFKSDVDIIQKSWLFFELLDFYCEESVLCRNYGINHYKDKSLSLIHLCSRNVLEKDSKVDKEFSMEKLPNYQQMETALRNLQLFEFTKLIPEPLFIKNKDFLQDVLFYLLSSKGMIIEYENEIKIPPNSEKTLKILIKNKTDWNLKDMNFQAEITPLNRISLQKIDPPRLQEFLGDFKLEIHIKSTDKTGKCKLKIKISIEDPFNSDKRRNIIKKTIGIQVIP